MSTDDIVKQVLTTRREAMLRAISADCLYAMHRRVTGHEEVRGASVVRAHMLEYWDLYRDELRGWSEFTITGESTL